jgi:cytochrome c
VVVRDGVGGARAVGFITVVQSVQPLIRTDRAGAAAAQAGKRRPARPTLAAFLQVPMKGQPMKPVRPGAAFAGAAALFAAIFMSSAASAAIDGEAAQALAKKNDCFKCHAIDKSKKGPSIKKIAEKYKGKADAEEKAIKNMTVSQKVKLDDGSEEDHPTLKTTDNAAIKNLAQWMLSR